MITLRYAAAEDQDFWAHLDNHLCKKEFQNKIYVKQGYIIEADNKPIGILRYNLFWDEIPFLNLIYLDSEFQKKGFGTKALLSWENEMRSRGYKLVMTSTMADESAQTFYRKLNYKDCGCLVKNMEPYVEAMELFLMKQL